MYKGHATRKLPFVKENTWPLAEGRSGMPIARPTEAPQGSHQVPYVFNVQHRKAKEKDSKLGLLVFPLLILIF